MIELSTDTWNSFARANDAQHLVDNCRLNSLAACSDWDTHSAFQLIYEVLTQGGIVTHAFDFRCDSPDRYRQFRLSLTRLAKEDGRIVILHESRQISSHKRKRIPFFDHRRIASQAIGDLLISLCSFCQRVCDKNIRTWIEADLHPLAGLEQGFRIGHGVCPDCRDRVVAPVLGIASARRSSQSPEVQKPN